ncbi:hypothetical protein GGR57DRAFT_268696 [Xylariaceae sp. FL1272]|nr:hypothetical protein GGR57DRAFT_268696 [Xylariaceae sp. FL1272]
MSFGSTKPTSKSQTPLQLQWDCSHQSGAIRKLVDLWIAEADGTARGKPLLNDQEGQIAASIIREDALEVANKVEAILRMDKAHFIRVRAQLLSLLLAWEQVMLEKKRYDEEGLRPSGRAEDLSPHQFLILFHTVYRRAQAGLIDLTSSSASGSTAPAATKRSIESDSPPPPMKRVKPDGEREGETIEGGGNGVKRRADEQREAEPATKRARSDE